MQSESGADVFEPVDICFAMGGVFVEFEKDLLLLKRAHYVAFAKLHIVYLNGGFDDMFDVNMRFGAGIFIYNYLECILVCLTARKLFWVVVNNSFR